MSSETRLTAGAPPTPSTSAGSSPDDASQRPRRARTSKPKVKTGCNNCKQRRIKCDEQRPSCANCIRSKKVCTGYPPPSRSARPFEEIRIAPKPLMSVSAPPPGREPVTLAPRRAAKIQRRNPPPPTSIPNIAILHRPSVDIPFSTQEGLYFQLFREQTASELSGYFDSTFWARSVLRECHSEASIRHAVVALGALYKTLEKSTESPTGSPSADRDPSDTAHRHWEIAVKQYSAACTELVASSSDSSTNRTRLMASVLLACFDSFIGDHKQAIVQIQTGLGLLEQLRAERRRAFLPRPEEPVEEELIQMFTRLAIQAKSYDMAFHFPQPWVVRLTTTQPQDPGSPTSESSSPVSIHQDPIPDRFSSIKEARLTWDSLAERIFRFTETMFNQAQSGALGLLPASARQYGLRFKQQMEAWSAAFEHILASRTAPGVSNQEKACITVLKMYQVMSQLLFLMTFSDSEMQFDHFYPDFKMIIELAIEVVGDEERRAALKRCPDPQFCRHRGRHEPGVFGGHNFTARHIKASFSADLGIVPPLFVVATKCRDRDLRKQAIQLLQSSPRREGMWDSELTARIALWIAEIEEGVDGESEDSFNGASMHNFHMDLNLDAPNSPPEDGSDQSRPTTSGSSFSRPNGQLKQMQQMQQQHQQQQQQQQQHQQQLQQQLQHRPPSPPKVIPEEKRVMVRAVEFDLRERFAVVQLGSRGLPNGAPDLKTRVTKIMW
ncbi:hypothetical protein B0T25DRAFT_446507 [Lasiosphaeria hispida]|uniref:Zn(2)-C6 fungal-type domain-containing protein n=1 Tax=Lasiosphaeria hispida TaxID=260671 RepID=A0AAJ0MI72_9PEZI|nr:hypothetical protein B0T25DRAFT_446507 [Lasiosphaeria hispida]